jgi:hypothetical protein
MLPGNSIHYNLEKGVLRITGCGHASTLLCADKRFESCVDDAHGEAEVAVELGDGCIFRSPPGRCCICFHCGTVVRRHDGARHMSECQMVAWCRAIQAHVEEACVGGVAGRLGGAAPAHCWELVAHQPVPPCPASRQRTRDELERAHADSIGHARVPLWRALVDEGWHDDEVPVPADDDVLMLRSCEVSLFASLSDMFTGTCSAASNEVTAEHVLHVPTLAPELHAAAARVTPTEAAASWERYIQNFDLFKLGGASHAPEKVRADSTVSYGKHSNTVTPVKGVPTGSAGYFSYGQFENIHHEGLKKNQYRCVTEKTAQFLDECALPCLRSLSILPDAHVFRPRLQHLRNCRTKLHSDRERGDTHAFVRWDTRDATPAALLFDTHILYRTTVCSWKGRLMVPMCTVSGNHTAFRCVAWTADGGAVQVVLARAMAETADWQEVGDLDVVVGGLRDGHMVCSQRLDCSTSETIASTMESSRDGPSFVLSVQEALDMANKNGRRARPPRRWVCVGWDKQWVGFRGWAVAHMLVGGYAPRRVHVYSRIVQEHPSCASAGRIEYVLDIEDGADELDELCLSECPTESGA